MPRSIEISSILAVRIPPLLTQRIWIWPEEGWRKHIQGVLTIMRASSPANNDKENDGSQCTAKERLTSIASDHKTPARFFRPSHLKQCLHPMRTTCFAPYTACISIWDEPGPRLSTGAAAFHDWWWFWVMCSVIHSPIFVTRVAASDYVFVRNLDVSGSRLDRLCRRLRERNH